MTRSRRGDKSGAATLAGQILIASPSMRDPRFARSLVYMLAHSTEGAMGLVVNKPTSVITFPFLAAQLGVKVENKAEKEQPAIYFGGPVETRRGFVLHSTDYRSGSTTVLARGIGLTTTPNIIRDIAAGRGPREFLLALGYAGWGQGQLESEMKELGWLHIPAETQLVFGRRAEDKWSLAVAKLGFDLASLSSAAGSA